MYSYKKLSVQQRPTQRLSPQTAAAHKKLRACALVCARYMSYSGAFRRTPTQTLAQSSGDVRAKIRSRTVGIPPSHSALLLQNQARALNFSQRGARDTESWQARGLPPLRICSPPATHARAGARTTCQDEGQQWRAEHSPSSPPLHLSKRRLQPTTSSHRHIEE